MSLRGDPAILKSQIDYSARRLGKVMNPRTGEEPGKAHHELPSFVNDRGLSTAYNGCDTTAELLRRIAALAEHDDGDMLDRYQDVISEGIGYIERHINSDGLFIEDPKFSGAQEEDGRMRKFALKVTYWKDSELNRLGSREPNYPIVYTLAHFQNAEALHRIGTATGNEIVAKLGSYMTRAGLEHLWAGDHFVTAHDGEGIIDSPNSDSLHSLLYISPDEIAPTQAQDIERYMQQLETPAGYRSGIPVAPEVDDYHMKVWTHEQALLNAAAKKHQLSEAQDITTRIAAFIFPQEGIFPELIDPDTHDPHGNLKQLWAMAAYLYFQNPEQALL
jgi:glycogen debranching enzyme